MFKHLNPRTIQPFYEAEKIRIKEKLEIIDFTAWRNGIYSNIAFSVSLSNAFGKSAKYIEKPIGISEKEEEREYTEEEKTEIQRRMLMQLQVAQINYEHSKK